MDIKFSGKYKFQNSIDTTNFNLKLAECLTSGLKNKRASVNVKSEALFYETSFVVTLISTKMNLFYRLFWFGKGKVMWKHEKQVIEYKYWISLVPIFVSSLILTLTIIALMLFTGNFGTYILMRNGLVLFLTICFFGITISKSRMNILINNCILNSI